MTNITLSYSGEHPSILDCNAQVFCCPESTL